jgi:hypothetical protein
MLTTCAVVEVATAAEPAAEMSMAPGSQRYRYVTLVGPWLKYVIVDIDAAGRESWSEQYSGEYRWHPHRPSTTERAMVRRWLTAGESSVLERLSMVAP